MSAPLLAGYVSGHDGETYCTVNADAVTAVHTDARAPQSTMGADGYGETGTRYRLTLADGRTRRVYVRQYGNAGTVGVYVRGVFASLALSTEQALTDDPYADDAFPEFGTVNGADGGNR
jgi:hypothetical protein